MRRMVGFMAAAFAALGLWTASAQAAGTFHPRVGGALGLVPSHAAQDIATGAPIDAVYHGGPVMSGGVTLHTIFWAPPGYTFDSGYEALIKKFLTDSAVDSGGTTNMYSVLTQYGQQPGPDTATAGSYSMSYSAGADSMDVNTPYPPVADQCSSPSGVTTCLTDGQIQAEIDAVAPANERGLHNIWFVLLPPNVDECITAGVCGSNAFAGYHSLMDLAGGLTIYSVIINPLIEVVLGPGADPQGNPNAEASADTVAHETTEAITDPEGTGWMDPNGFEVGDKCEFGPQVGTPLGTASDGSPFDELINGGQYLIQEMWSNADGGCVQRTTQTTSPLPLPQINLTQYGSTVTGNIGSTTSGVGVALALYRAEPQDSTGVAQLARGSTTTDAGGNWSVSLAPFAVGDDRDVIVVTYSGSPLQPDVIATGSGGNPFTESGFTGWFDLDTGFDVSNQSGGFVTLGPCFQTGVLSFNIGASPFAPTPHCNTQTDVASVPTGAIPATGTVTVSSNDNRAFLQPTPGTPFPLAPQGNEAGALVDLTMTTGEPDAFSAFASPIAAVLPLGAPTGFPSCTADLQAGTATCTGLVPGGSYTVTRARGGDQLDGVADSTGTVSVGPFAGGHPLQGGDVLALSNGTTTLTTLRVAALVAKISGDQTALDAGSTCQAGEYYGPPLSTNPISSAAGLTGVGGATLTGEICPASGSAVGLPTSSIEQTDDASGGLTQTEVANIENTSPLDGETVYGPFRALAQAGLPGPSNSVTPNGFPVSVTITKAGDNHEVFSAANVNTAAGSPVTGLDSGAYDAAWTWTDSNGDSRALTTRFVEEPGSGAPGPSGPPGPPGPPGTVKVKVTVTCTTTSHNNIVCVVAFSQSDRNGTLFVRLDRGTDIAALAHARLLHGRARLTLHARTVRPGRWTATLVRVGAHGSAQTTTMTVRLHRR